MSRVISMYLPTWPTDRLARTLGARAPSPDTPLVLAGREGNRRIVHALNRIAQTAGLRRMRTGWRSSPCGRCNASPRSPPPIHPMAS
jgi:hypothetical protein